MQRKSWIPRRVEGRLSSLRPKLQCIAWRVTAARRPIYIKRRDGPRTNATHSSSQLQAFTQANLAPHLYEAKGELASIKEKRTSAEKKGVGLSFLLFGLLCSHFCLSYYIGSEPASSPSLVATRNLCKRFLYRHSGALPALGSFITLLQEEGRFIESAARHRAVYVYSR